eukprot:6178083-Pleurochrysis_carterae.AAC.3
MKYGPRDSQAPSNGVRPLHCQRQAHRCGAQVWKALTLENYQLQYVELVEKMNRLLKYEDASLLNHCIIMGAHV